MQMKKISDEDNLARRREPLTEDEAEILIERYRAKTIALVTLILMHLNLEKNYSSSLGFKSITAYYSRESMLELVISNHKKGILPITDDECRFIIDHDYTKDQNIFNCLMGSLSSDTKSSLKKEIASHYDLLKDCYNANGQKRCYFGEYVKIIAESLDVFSLRTLLNDNEMDEDTKSIIYSIYIQERFASNERDLIFVNGVFHESENGDKVSSLIYLDKFFQNEGENISLNIYDGMDIQMSPVLDYYYAGNYAIGKKVFELCDIGDNFDLPRRILFLLLNDKRFKELIELMSLKSFNIILDDEVIEKIESSIPKDELYTYMDAGNIENFVGITDEFTESLVGILRKKPGIVNNKEAQMTLDSLLERTKREGVHTEEMELLEEEARLRNKREVIVKTLNLLQEKAADVIPWKHMIKEMPYGGKRSE